MQRYSGLLALKLGSATVPSSLCKEEGVSASGQAMPAWASTIPACACSRHEALCDSKEAVALLQRLVCLALLSSVPPLQWTMHHSSRDTPGGLTQVQHETHVVYHA